MVPAARGRRPPVVSSGGEASFNYSVMAKVWNAEVLRRCDADEATTAELRLKPERLLRSFRDNLIAKLQDQDALQPILPHFIAMRRHLRDERETTRIHVSGAAFSVQAGSSPGHCCCGGGHSVAISATRRRRCSAAARATTTARCSCWCSAAVITPQTRLCGYVEGEGVPILLAADAER